MKRYSCVLVLILLTGWLLLTPIVAEAQENQFITIVNPVRIAAYTKNPQANLQAQYSEVRKRNLPATWLLTDEAINHQGIYSVIKQMDQDQEVGIWLEITEEFAKKSGVVYNKTDSWHRSTSVFLSGYSREDRVRLIDTVFGNFKKRFGYYPTSVGAWWVDSFSLEYMSDKYGVTANLGVADQFSTDGYQVWGQYWSTPFYPSKLHSGMPAHLREQKLDVVTLQWAARDPLNGYGQSTASLYSTQDYFTINLGDDYFDKLINLYALKHHNQFGQITIGLEADLSPESYRGTYAIWLNQVKQYQDRGQVRLTTMKAFSQWYRQKFPEISPPHLIISDDLLGEKKQSIWYQSPYYRIGMIADLEKRQIRIIDWRTFQNNFEEPFNQVPNKQLDLLINTPSVIDTANNPDEIWVIENIEELNVEQLPDQVEIEISQEKKITLSSDKILLTGLNQLIPFAVKSSPFLKSNRSATTTQIQIRDKFIVDPPGLLVRELTPEASYFLKMRKVQLGLILAILLIGGSSWLIIRSKFEKVRKVTMLGLMMGAIMLSSGYLLLINSKLYLVSQAEVDTLLRLLTLDRGKVLVIDQDCLQCKWHWPYQPAAFANKRDYVNKISHQPVIYNSAVFKAVDRQQAKQALEVSQAKYIYLTKHGDYLEQLPFSPGDYGIERIYANADSELWKVIRK